MKIITHTPTEIEIACLKSLPQSQQAFVALRQEKPFSQYGLSEQKTFCVKILTKAFVDASPNGMPTPEILSFQMESLLKEINGKFSQLTVSEIATAFDRGIRGDSGPFFGMCSKTYHQFLKWFTELPERSAAWAKYLEVIDSVKISDRPIFFTEDRMREIVIDNFKIYREKKILPFAPHAIYDTIKSLVGVNTLFDEKSWQEAKEVAKKAIEKRFSSRDQTEKLKLALNSGSKSMELEIKSIGVKMFFDKLIKEGKELTNDRNTI